jgi:tRNA A37 threonylcarbamoyladenosine biosynthesis protein TsaE
MKTRITTLAVHYLRWMYEARTAASRDARGVVAVEFSRELAEELHDWSVPVQIRIRTTDGHTTMQVRSIQQHQQATAHRAARQ